jgi:glycerol-3-phosphate O-acyltransferase/dihydroxyacetone phosphate acyltransferase
VVRSVLVRLFRGLMALYFRSIEEVGDRPLADVGGRLFVSNHQNALIDPILVITRAPCEISPVAKSTLWKIPGLKWLLDQAKAVPIIRRRDDPEKSAATNDAVFEKVGGFLAKGGNILIFPEGTSHNEPQLQKLKTGAARMLLRAEEANGPRSKELTFQAVGLEFEARDVFRSRVVVVYGPVRRIAEIDGVDSGARVQKITETMRDDLAELLVEGATWSERLLIARVAELLRNESGDVSLAQWNSIGRAVEAAKKAFDASDPAKVEPVARSVTAYFEALERAGLRDELLASKAPPAPRGGSFGAFVRRALFPLAALGVILYFVPYQIPRAVARREADADVHSTLKLGTGLAVFPIWAALLATALGLFVHPGWLAAVLASIAVLAPFIALDRLEHEGAFSRGFQLARRSAMLTELARLRAKALAAIEEARAATGAS